MNEHAGIVIKYYHLCVFYMLKNLWISFESKVFGAVQFFAITSSTRSGKWFMWATRCPIQKPHV